MGRGFAGRRPNIRTFRFCLAGRGAGKFQLPFGTGVCRARAQYPNIQICFAGRGPGKILKGWPLANPHSVDSPIGPKPGTSKCPFNIILVASSCGGNPRHSLRFCGNSHMFLRSSRCQKCPETSGTPRKPLGNPRVLSPETPGTPLRKYPPAHPTTDPAHPTYIHTSTASDPFPTTTHARAPSHTHEH